MKFAWDERYSDSSRHRIKLRRRWSPELRRSTEYFCGWPCVRDVEVAPQKHAAKSPKPIAKKLSKMDSVNAGRVLQLQSESFFRALELEALRNNVAELVSARTKAEESLRLFQKEVKSLELGLQAAKSSETLDYEISEDEWSDIIER